MPRNELDNANKTIEVFFGKYSDMVYRIAVSKLISKEEAKDVTQDVFIKLLEQLLKGKAFTDDEHCKAWLIRVAVNMCKNKLNSYWFKRIIPFSKEFAKKQVECFKEDLSFEIGCLPPKQREVIYLFYYENYSADEIATILKRKKNTVLSQLSRARNSLKSILEET